MSEPPPSGVDRPVLLGQMGPPSTARPGGGPRRGPRGAFRDPEARLARLDAGFRAASAALKDEIQLSSSVPSSDPHLVLVLVALEASVDLTGVALRLGLDVLFDVEGEERADEQYGSASDDAVFPSSLYAVAIDSAALDGLLLAWRRWKRGEALARGTTPLRDLLHS